jgi:hypothetical protein
MALNQSRPGNLLTDDDYFDAAREHVSSLSGLYNEGHYALAIYVAGLAVESLFRAFRAKRKLPFRSDHPLKPLAEEAGFPALVPDRDRVRFDAALSDLIVSWRNAHRFRSNSAMRRFLNRLSLDRGIKGDFVKEWARRITSASIELVTLGEKRWQN